MGNQVWIVFIEWTEAKAFARWTDDVSYGGRNKIFAIDSLTASTQRLDIGDESASASARSARHCHAEPNSAAEARQAISPHLLM